MLKLEMFGTSKESFRQHIQRETTNVMSPSTESSLKLMSLETG